MKYLLVAMLAWLVAQSLKHIARLFGRNRRVFNSTDDVRWLLSGGMPSAHSATVTALTLMIGYYDGWGGAMFALSALFSAIVMYDAVMVRYSSGQQGDLLNKLIKSQKSRLEPVRVAHGHTLVEVAAGVVVGLFVAGVVIFATHYL